ncbi:MAG: COX15/CtaA family protein [Saprospiraceae bacterium]|nr:COX15/CtaA family protein [Saprospiraceae bacterium]
MTNELLRFRRWGLATTIATIFLIWVGGWVRSTGSGMGCPDWPKCFGVLVPPTSESELPADYLQHYTDLRKKKNERVAKMLNRLGMSETANRILNDPSVSEHEPFNAYKTWTEYINRLVGVAVGLLIFLTLLFSIPLRKVDKRIFWLSLAGFICVGFEGWLGSLVVSTNLMPSFITVHMVVAMLLLVFLISAVLIAYTHKSSVSDLLTLKPMGLIWGGVGVSVLVLIQVIIGTQVRESVDLVSAALGEENRHEWIPNLDSIYRTHRTFYYIVTAAIMYWVWLLRGRFFKIASIKWFSTALLAVLIAEILMGLTMHYYNIPPFLQPLHLLFGTLLFAGAYTVTGILYLKKN